MSEPILVTGANGFVGSHVVEELLKAGYPIRCLLRSHSQPTWIETLPVDIQRADYFDPNALRRVIAGCRAILHFGGATKAKSREAYFRANAAPTGALLRAASEVCPNLSLFLLCSSQAALGPSPSLDPLGEDAPPQPVSTYGWSKLMAENVCREYQDRLPIAIMRPPAIYGPRDKDILIIFRAINLGFSPSLGRGDRYISLVHVSDVAKITRLILEKKPPSLRIYHVTDGQIHRWSEVAQVIAHTLDKTPLRINIPAWLAIVIGRALSGLASVAGRMATLNRDKLNEILSQYWLMSSRRAEEELGFVPDYHLEDGIGMTARWYQEHGWLY